MATLNHYCWSSLQHFDVKEKKSSLLKLSPGICAANWWRQPATLTWVRVSVTANSRLLTPILMEVFLDLFVSALSTEASLNAIIFNEWNIFRAKLFSNLCLVPSWATNFRANFVQLWSIKMIGKVHPVFFRGETSLGSDLKARAWSKILVL